MMDKTMGEGEIKHLLTFGMMDNIIGEERAEISSEMRYDNQYLG